MGINITGIEESIDESGIKMLVYGDAGAGKTVLLASSNTPTLIINAEGGLKSIKTAVRQGILDESVLDIVKQVSVKSIADLDEVYNHISRERPEFDWICLDSITEIGEVVLAHEMGINKDPRKAYGNLTTEINKRFKKFRDLKGYNVGMSAKLDRIADGDTGKTTYGPMMPGQKLGPQVPYLFDEVWALRVETDDEGAKYRILQCDGDVNYRAKSRHGLDDFEPANLAEIMDKLEGLGFDKVSPADYVVESEEEDESDVADEDRYYYHSESDSVILLPSGEDLFCYGADVIACLTEIDEDEYNEHLASQVEESEEEEAEVEDVESEEDQSDDPDEEEVEEESEEEEEDEEFISEKDMYWYHTGKKKTLTTEKGDDISALLSNDEVEQITKVKFAKLNK